MLFIFSTPVLIRHLWQLKTVDFLHWCLIRALPLKYLEFFVEKFVSGHLMVKVLIFI